MLVAPNGQVHPFWNVSRADTFECRRPGPEPFLVSVLVKDEDTKVLALILKFFKGDSIFIKHFIEHGIPNIPKAVDSNFCS
jgi:hypothetical protein